MPMRLELGMLTVQVERQEDATSFLCGLFRHLTNKEVAELMGVTDKTVRRWQQAGRLPTRNGGQIMLLDLLQHASSGLQVNPTRRGGRAGRTARGESGAPID